MEVSWSNEERWGIGEFTDTLLLIGTGGGMGANTYAGVSSSDDTHSECSDLAFVSLTAARRAAHKLCRTGSSIIGAEFLGTSLRRHSRKVEISSSRKSSSTESLSSVGDARIEGDGGIGRGATGGNAAIARCMYSGSAGDSMKGWSVRDWARAASVVCAKVEA